MSDTKHGQPADDELDDFRAAMSDVEPLQPSGTVRSRERSAGPTLAQQAQRENAEREDTEANDPNPFTLGEVHRVDPDEVLEYVKNGVQPRVFSKLRREGYPIEAELDLHRKTVSEARDLVFGFLAGATQRGQRAVSINHGRGRESPEPAKLKSYVAAWLHDYPPVLAYTSAPRNRGGSGVLYVLLQKSKDAKAENRERHGGRA